MIGAQPKSDQKNDRPLTRGGAHFTERHSAEAKAAMNREEISPIVKDLLGLAIQRCGGQREMARKMGLAPGSGNITAWLSGTIPRADYFVSILSLAGGDIFRALPDQPDRVEEPESHCGGANEVDQLRHQVKELTSRLKRIQRLSSLE